MSLQIQLAIAAIVGLLSSYLANRKGRNPYLWFVIGFVFGILGILALFIAPKAQKQAPQIKTEPQPFIDGPIDRFWYYLDPSHRQQGPMSHNALTQAWKKGEIARTTLVWHEDLSDWKELQEFIKFRV